MEWSRKKYNEYYESYVPWLEDKFLGWYGENKASYTAKENMKTHALPDQGPTSGVNKLQDSVADGVGGQLDNDGLLGGVGQQISDQGITRTERGEPQKQGGSWANTLSAGYVDNKGKK